MSLPLIDHNATQINVYKTPVHGKVKKRHPNLLPCRPKKKLRAGPFCCSHWIIFTDAEPSWAKPSIEQQRKWTHTMCNLKRPLGGFFFSSFLGSATECARVRKNRFFLNCYFLEGFLSTMLLTEAITCLIERGSLITWKLSRDGKRKLKKCFFLPWLGLDASCHGDALIRTAVLEEVWAMSWCPEQTIFFGFREI